MDLTNGRIRAPTFFVDSSGGKIGGWKFSTTLLTNTPGHGTIGGVAAGTWPNVNVAIDSTNARIIIRNPTANSNAGINHVVLGYLGS